MEKRRFIYLELPGETICLDVPFVEPVRDIPFARGSAPGSNQVDAADRLTNLTYDTRPSWPHRLAYDYKGPDPQPNGSYEAGGHITNITYDG